MKRAFADALTSAEELVERRAPVDEILHRHTASVDEILRTAFAGAMSGVQVPAAGIALVALGGYGRRELAPGSDLDLLLVHRGWKQEDVVAVNRRLTYPLWDAGREVGARVREPKDVVRILGRADEAAALLDARLLAGDEGLFSEVYNDVVRRLERSRASFFSQLAIATAERHQRFGATGHLLEPNIRDGAGGLRDIHTVGWASILLPGTPGLDGLVASGFLSALDRDLLVAARAFLLNARIHLHLITRRRQDQLYLADQDAIATQLGYEERSGRAVADAFMQELYQHARHTNAIVSSFWELVTRRRPRRSWRTAPARVVGDGCVVRDGQLEVVALTNPHDDPAAWLRVFLRAIREDVRVGRGSLNRLQSSVGPGALTWTSEAREVFTEILQTGEAGAGVLEAMDATGFLEALIPEWAGVRCLPQRDLYHRFTVDIHLFATAAELAASRLSSDVVVHDAWLRVSNPRPLFVAALLHDIGKGRGGNHSEIGTRMAADVAVRMRLDANEIADVTFLVERHLSLASLAMQRDLNEPRTIETAVEQVGYGARLAMLYLLTRADSISTGPEAWSTFRAALVGELYAKTLRALEGRAEPTPERAVREASLIAEPLADDEVRTMIAKRDEAHELVLVSRDRPGLFAGVCGVLALRGIDIHDAEIYTRPDGIAVEIFRVKGTHGEIPEERWDRVGRDVRAAIAGELDLDEALARKTKQERHRRAGQRRPAPESIVIDNDASETHTVVEVHAADHLGLLRDITRALHRSGCDVSLAKVATYGADVVDVFYVRDFDGSRITSEDHVRSIEEALRQAAGSR
jgi:[protein-PII] uridylyltransferase